MDGARVVAVALKEVRRCRTWIVVMASIIEVYGSLGQVIMKGPKL